MLLEQLPHQLIESMLIAAWAIQATRGYIFLRGEYVLAARAPAARAGRGAQPRLPGREHPRHRLELRSHPAHRCRALHLRRGNGADQLARGPARQPARQAAVPADRGRLGPADDRQQRRDLLQPARDRAARRRLVQGPVARAQHGRRHQDLRRLRAREAPRTVGAADGHHRARDPRAARRRHAGRPAAEGLAAGRRLHRLPAPRAPRPRDGLRHHRQGAQPPRHGPARRGRRHPGHRPRGAQPAGVLRARILRLVHAVPRRAAVVGEAAARDRARRGAAGRHRTARAPDRAARRPARPTARSRPAPWSRCRARCASSAPNSSAASRAARRTPRARNTRNGNDPYRRHAATRSTAATTCCTPVSRWAWTSPTSAGTRRWARWAPAASAQSSSTPTPRTRAGGW